MKNAATSPYVVAVLLLAIALAAACASQSGSGAATGLATEVARTAVSPVSLETMEPHLDVDWTFSCVECHTEETPEITAQWAGGKHGEVNVKCYVCHGDGQQEFRPRPTTERCVGCHDGHAVEFDTSVATSCFSCHQGHTLKFHD